MHPELMTPNLLAMRTETFPTNLLAPCPEKPARLSLPSLSPRPLLRGDRAYLRALRAAEMKAWQASGGDVFRPRFAE
jgi:hypothetical protein